MLFYLFQRSDAASSLHIDNGCYTDLVNSARSLPNTLTGKSNFTVESCLAAAKAGGYAVAGLSYYGEYAHLAPYLEVTASTNMNFRFRKMLRWSRSFSYQFLSRQFPL
jgi:hypothetical protein